MMSLCDFEQCNICLANSNRTVNLQDSDENEIKWFTKLQFTIPELEWLEEYLICELCVKQLEKAWEFKKLVLNLEAQRRLCLTRKTLYCEENDDFKDSCDTTDYFFREEKESACEICLKTFTTQTQLRHHILQNHNEENSQKINNKCVTNKMDLFTCYDCDVSFSTKNSMLYHIENGHDKICQNLCTNDLTLKSHMKCEHNAETQESVEKLSEHIPLRKIEFQCFICKECYSCKTDLQKHLELCNTRPGDNNTIYQCDTCKKSYVSEKNLNLHKPWCSKEDKYTNENSVSYNCDKCTDKFNSLKEYDAHNLLKHEIGQEPLEAHLGVKKRRGRRPLKIFCCEVCGKQFEYVKLVIEHCMSDHGMQKKSIKPYTCEKCEMRFASSANLDQHRHYHERNRKHVCSLCGKGFITKSDLTVHEYTHYNRRNYKCNKCDKAFNTNKNLRTHNLVVHTDRALWKYGCTICEKRFPLKTNYDQHLRRHTGDKKYGCHICGKPFVSKTEMKRHINLHSNIKAFKCSICEKEYKERRTYEIHLTKVHSIGNAKIPIREKKFVCHICPSQFYDKQKLSKHLCSHSGLKPFPCYACDKKFTDKSYLKHHLKAVHNIIEPSRMGFVE